MQQKGNIGIFDSGLGGLWILKHLKEKLPEYNYVFLGDEKHMPYGDKNKEEIFSYTTSALRYLFEVENCMGVIIACNTVSSTIYDELREWKDENYFGRIIFGIARPTIMSIKPDEILVIFATFPTCNSTVYDELLHSRTSDILKIPLPELASKIERGESVQDYLMSFVGNVPEHIKQGALLCTHYGIVREEFRKVFPNILDWSFQEESVPRYIQEYFLEFPEREMFFTHNATLRIITSKKSDVLTKFAKEWFGEKVEINEINL